MQLVQRRCCMLLNTGQHLEPHLRAPQGSSGRTGGRHNGVHGLLVLLREGIGKEAKSTWHLRHWVQPWGVRQHAQGTL